MCEEERSGIDFHSSSMLSNLQKSNPEKFQRYNFMSNKSPDNSIMLLFDFRHINIIIIILNLVFKGTFFILFFSSAILKEGLVAKKTYNSSLG